MKKRIFVFALILAMALSMTACGGMLGSLLNKDSGTLSAGNGFTNNFAGVMNGLEDILDSAVTEAPKPTKAPAADAPAIDAPVADIPAAAPMEEVEDTSSYALRDYIYGTWQRETMYLEFYGCDAIMYTTFLRNGRAEQVLVHADNGEILNESAGDWTFDGDGVYLIKDGESGKISFSYNTSTHKLKNGDKQYTKISD